MNFSEKLVKIEAVIRPYRLEAVQEALYDLDLHAMTVTDVRGSGKHRGVSHTFRGSTYGVNLTPWIKVEVILSTDEAETVVEAIRQAADTGELGAGTIFVSPVGEAIRVRTGERGEEALS